MKSYLSCLGALSFGIFHGAMADARSAPHPNVLLIMTDDLGWGDLGCYGAPDTKTPNIDRLASEGVRMRNFHANAPVSSPARAALLTGCFPDKMGVQGVIRHDRVHNYGDLKDDVPTIADSFRAGGYHTCLLGKWHLGLTGPDLPNDRGFDEFKGLLAGSVSDNYEHKLDGINFMRENTREITTSGVHITDLITDWSIDYLKGRKGKGNPFFLFLSYTAPHAPIQPAEASLQRVLRREKGIDSCRARFVALVEHVDESIGKVIKTLEKTGQLDNTLIIFMSDNGGDLKHKADNGPYIGGKRDLWEGGLKVPFVINNPRYVGHHREPDNIMTTMDIFPTLLDLAGLKKQIPASIDGASFAELLRGNEFKDPDRNLYFIYREGWVTSGLARRGIMFDGWKVFQSSATGDFHYVKLEEDEFEKNPKSRNEVPADVEKKFRKLMNAHISELGSVPWQRAE